MTPSAVQEQSVTPLSSFILKVASRCNLDCTYCYEYNMGDQSWRTQPHFISMDTVCRAAQRVREHAQVHGLKLVAFSFHGGEPLLAGPEFFVKAVGAIREILGPELACSFGVQTNGTLITEELVRLFSEENIHIGLSLDGPAAVNDRNRVYTGGRGSHADVMRGVHWLSTVEGRKIFRGILAVVDLDANPMEVFESLAAIGPPSIDFLLPHGNWAGPPPGRPLDPRSTPYADWLIRIFDAWFAGRHSSISIRTFEEIIEYKLGGKGRLETLGLSPVSLICVAADGSIEGVDTLKASFPGAHKLGLNVYEHSFDDVLQHPSARERQLGLGALHQKCVECEYVGTCGGGYYPHRWSPSNGFRNPSVYCPDLMRLIGHIQEAVGHARHRK